MLQILDHLPFGPTSRDFKVNITDTIGKPVQQTLNVGDAVKLVINKCLDHGINGHFALSQLHLHLPLILTLTTYSTASLE